MWCQRGIDDDNDDVYCCCFLIMLSTKNADYLCVTAFCGQCCNYDDDVVSDAADDDVNAALTDVVFLMPFHRFHGFFFSFFFLCFFFFLFFSLSYMFF